MTAAQPAAQSSPRKFDLTQRNAILDEEIQKCPTTVSNGKYTFPIQVRTDRSAASAVVTYGKSWASPLMIVLLSVLSLMCGLVLPYWLYKLVRPKYNKAISVDESGDAHWAPWVSPAERVLAVVMVGAFVFGIVWGSLALL